MEKWIILNPPYDNYAISNYGNVKNVRTGHILKQFEKHNGYMGVSLWVNNKGKSFKIHRLVALYFIKQNNEKDIYVNHIDGNKKNNFYKNLEWVTPSKNCYEAVKLGLVNAVRVKITDLTTGESLCFYSLTQCANHFGLDKRALGRALKRQGHYKNYFIKRI